MLLSPMSPADLAALIAFADGSDISTAAMDFS